MADQVYSEPRSGNPPALFVRPDLERFYSFNSFSLSVLSTVKIPSNRYNKAGLYIFLLGRFQALGVTSSLEQLPISVPSRQGACFRLIAIAIGS
jgi:hypothetical protein